MIDLLLAVTILLFLTWYTKGNRPGKGCPDKNDNHLIVVQNTANEPAQKEDQLMPLMDPVRRNQTRPTRHRVPHGYPSADVVTFVSKMRVCGAIFKNPEDKQTHFYRYRLKGKDDDCPLEIRNIGAAIKLWGKHWENINNIKIFEAKASEIEEPSVWLSRLEDQQEDCQNKYGCRISLQDFEYISSIEKRVFKDLTRKIIDCCLSEDDLVYFSGADDSSIINKHYFDI